MPLPLVLRRVKRKHCILAKIERAKKAFAGELLLLESDVSSDVFCCVCRMSSGDVDAVVHLDAASTCKCSVHTECLRKWIAQREERNKRIRVCPACRGKLAMQQPKRSPPAVCGSVLQAGLFCKKKVGHLGNCG